MFVSNSKNTFSVVEFPALRIFRPAQWIVVMWCSLFFAFALVMLPSASRAGSASWFIILQPHHTLQFFFVSNGGSKYSQALQLYLGGRVVGGSTIVPGPKGPFWWWTNSSGGSETCEIKILQYDPHSPAHTGPYLSINANGAVPRWSLTAPTGENGGSTSVQIGVTDYSQS